MIANSPESLVRDVLSRVEQDRVSFINLQFTDLVGNVKSVTIPVEQFADCIEHGKWFDGSSVEGFARIAESDMYLKPDLSTFAVIPWEKGANVTARVICWVFTPKGELFEGDPRAVLARALDEAASLGYRYNIGPEVEFFLFKAGDGLVPVPNDQGGYFDLTTDTAEGIRKEMVEALHAMGIQVEASHHEVASGQHEVDLKYDDALRTADNTVTFKYTLKAIAQPHGLYATFMPKPIYGLDGSGMHTHQSLAKMKDGQNAFADPLDEYGLSPVAKHFIAGQLYHARGMSAIICPLVNSYKRLVPGHEAPVYISWARINRSALIRVPQVSPSRPEATRIELRSPDPSCNPYLAFAVMLKCGLDGIKKKLPLPEPVEENLYAFDSTELRRRDIGLLPSTLAEALDELRRDEVVQEALGALLTARYLEAKTMEWQDYRKHVSTWELEHYLRVF